ncbi:MAG: coproporphyrinogen III oxidase, partial [Rubrimonas sp.]
MTDAPHAPAAEMAEQRRRAAEWFVALRDRICAEFEAIEDEQTSGPFADLPPGRFQRKETRRAGDGEGDQGGGVMSVMREGRVFEKVGVNVSEVYGVLGAQAQRSLTARREIPGLKDDPRFWAS